MSEPRSRKLELDTGLAYHILEWGADDASLDHTVVLVHGFLDLSWGWAPMVRARLAGRYHVVAPDMRGHGDSDHVGAGGYYHFMDYLADMDSLIRSVARGRMSLVGHSMGGSIAAYVAGAWPERVHRLAVLEGTGPPESTTPVPQLVKNWITGWRRAAAKEPKAYDSIADAAARLRKHDALLDEQLSLELAELGTTLTCNGYQFKHDPLHATMGPYPYRVEVAQSFWTNIACPVLFIEGSKSAFRHPPAEAERRFASFADRRHKTLEGAGHMMQRHQPKALAEMLTEFLDADL